MSGVSTVGDVRRLLIAQRGKVRAQIKELEVVAGLLDEMLDRADTKLCEAQASGEVVADVSQSDLTIKDAVEQVFRQHPNSALSLKQVLANVKVLGVSSEARHPTTVISSCVRRLMQEYEELQPTGVRGEYIWTDDEYAEDIESEQSD